MGINLNGGFNRDIHAVANLRVHTGHIGFYSGPTLHTKGQVHQVQIVFKLFVHSVGTSLTQKHIEFPNFYCVFAIETENNKNKFME